MQIIEPGWPAPVRVRGFSTTRSGGTSRGAYASLNLGMNSNDEAAAVAANRQQLSGRLRSEEHTSELQSRGHLVCRHLLDKKIIPRCKIHLRSTVYSFTTALTSTPAPLDEHRSPSVTRVSTSRLSDFSI